VKPTGPLLGWQDLRRLGALEAGAAASLLWPRRWDVALMEAWFRLYRKAAPSTLDRVAARMRSHLPAGQRDETELRLLAEQHVRSRLEDMWGRVRGLRRGFRPRIEAEGLEHVRGALARGRGAVVWCMRVGSAIVLKQGFREAGLPLTHLSRADHGTLTRTRVGIELVAPLYRRVEDRALEERVQIPLDGSLAYLETLAERLAANRCVSIFGEHPGRRSVAVTVVGVKRLFALGAPSVAWRADAGLITAYVLREGPFRHRMVVEEPIAVDRTVDRKRFAERAVHEFASRLERCIVRHPADWQGWFYLDALERQTGAAPETG
jgi:lauroyl/myristoyl acyltransferase